MMASALSGQAARTLTVQHPWGSFPVGRFSYDWTDLRRPETLSKVLGQHRELLVEVWYPAQQTGRLKRAEYIPQARAIDISAEAGIIKQLFGELWPEMRALEHSLS